ncbi:MAG: hypothetical protein AABX83_00015 [Nanoarchaeota archaeon]
MKITICPKCKSTNVRKEITIISVIGVPEQWTCNNCGFRGHIFPEVEIDNYKKQK